MLSILFIKHDNYLTSDVKTFAESPVHILHIFQITSKLKEIVYYRVNGLLAYFFDALLNKTIKYNF